jgi:hypothetical protein
MRKECRTIDSARNDPGLSPKVGPFHFHKISWPMEIAHPKEPKSSRAPPSEASIKVIGVSVWSRSENRLS